MLLSMRVTTVDSSMGLEFWSITVLIVVPSENLPGLCLHCQGGTVNSTETCCYQAKVEERCKGVKLPSIVDMPDGLLPLPTSSATPSPSSGGGGNKGPSGGVIAGIVIGVVIAVSLIAFLILYWRRRRQMQASENYLNRPTVHRPSPDRNMTYANSPTPHTNPQSPLDNGPGGRIARMSALESRNASRNVLATDQSSVPLALQERPSHRVIRNTSGDFHPSDSPDTRRSVKYTTDGRPLHPAPRDRNASLSSTSVLVSDRHGSDSEKDELVGSPVSEQLPYFKVREHSVRFHGKQSNLL